MRTREEKRVAKEIYVRIYAEIRRGEWINRGYLRWVRKDPNMVLDGSLGTGLSNVWKLGQGWDAWNTPRFDKFSWRQNLNITHLFNKVERNARKNETAEAGRKLLNELDPQAETRDAMEEIRTWIYETLKE